MPDGELQAIIEGGSNTWRRLAAKAQGIKSSLVMTY